MFISIFGLLCVVGFLAIFSSTISKSPVLPLFTAYLGADPSAIGFIASISAFTGIVASIPAGLLSDRFAREKMLLFSLLVFASAPFLYLLVTELWQLALIRLYHGLATAIFVPVAMALIADLFPRARGENIGWFSTANLGGRFLAPTAGGAILGTLSYNPELGFKLVYLLCGVTGTLALLVALKIPEVRTFVTPSEGKASPQPDKRWGEIFASFRLLLSNRPIMITAAVEASILFAYGTFETFLPLYSLQIGLSVQEIGIFISAQIITLALTKPIMGRLSDKYGRVPQILLGSFLGAICIGSFSLFKSFISILFLSILFGLSLSIVTSATSAFIADLSKRETRGSAMGILGSVMDIGHTTGPLISGFVGLHLGIEKSFIGVSLVIIFLMIVFAAFLFNFSRSA